MLELILICYGVSAALYGFRMVFKFFKFLEGQIRNGTIITSGIAAGLIWPITLILDGVRGVWEEIGPVKVIEPPAPAPTPPPLTPQEILDQNRMENLSDPR